MNKLDSMQTFVRVAEARSFTAVASQLGVARSVVTRQIAALEKSLRTQLITRSTRNLTLTPEGLVYLNKCNLILNLVDEAETAIHQNKDDARGSIRMSLPVNYGLGVLMPMLLDFAKTQPDIDLKLDFSDQRSNLIEAGLDLSIRITGHLQDNDIVRRLGQCHIVTVAAPHYWAAKGKPDHPLKLHHHDALVYSLGGSVWGWPYRVDGRPLLLRLRGRMMCNSGAALVQAAARGMGVTAVPDFIAAPWLERGEVSQALQAFAPEPLGIYAVLANNHYVPKRVSLLIEYLAQVLSAHGSGAESGSTGTSA